MALSQVSQMGLKLSDILVCDLVATVQDEQFKTEEASEMLEARARDSVTVGQVEMLKTGEVSEMLEARVRNLIAVR